MTKKGDDRTGKQARASAGSQVRQRPVVSGQAPGSVQPERPPLLSEEHFRLLIEGITDYAILTLDPKGYVTSWNQGAQRITGYQAEEIVGRHFSVFYAIEEVASTRPQRELLIAETQGHFSDEGWRVRKDGSRFWASLVITTLRDHDGRLSGFSMVARDITEHLRAEEQMLEIERRDVERVSERGRIVAEAEKARSRDRYQRLVDAVDGIVWEADLPSWRFTFVSKAAERLLGYPAQRWLNEPTFWHDHLHPDDQARAAAFRARVIMEHRGGEFSFRMIAADGRTVWLRGLFSLTPPVTLSGIMVDFTEAKAAEEEMREQSDLYAAVLRALSQLGQILMVSEGGQVAYFNPAFYEITGYSQQDLGGSPSLLEVVPKDERSGLMERLEDAASAGKAVLFETAIVSKDGRQLDLEVSQLNFESDGRVRSVTVARDITERKQGQRSLEHQAMRDDLTGLPNRALLRDRLRQAILTSRRANTPVGLLVMDIDNFKEVNDAFGHHAGDVLLIEVARRLRDGQRESDTVARLGGDEFAVVLPEADERGATQAALKVLRDMESPFRVGEGPLDVRLSIGIAIYPDHSDEGDLLLRRADIAMYVAKRSLAGHALYAPELEEHAPKRLALAAQLRLAIEQDQLSLDYQPLVSFITGHVTSVEALARWHHPERGLLLPHEFIPLAERTGLVRSLTSWALGTALRQTKAWEEGGRELPVSLNISPRDLLNPRLSETIATLLERHQLPPSRLGLEVAESATIVEPDRTITTLRALRETGLKISIDDFASGTSSLAMLYRIPADALKIDRSFVASMTAQASSATIVHAAIDLGHHLGFQVVAEGVEDRETWDELARLGCDLAQGYYVSPPLPGEQFESWVRGSPWA